MRTRACVAVVAFAVACSSAPTNGSAKVERDMQSTTPVHEDLERLATYIMLPRGAGRCRWVVLPRGVPGGLGPTDTVLSAFVELSADAWAELEKDAISGDAVRVSLPDATARAILPSVSGPSSADRVSTGRGYRIGARARMPYAGDKAVRVGDGLVFVLFTT